MQVPLWVFIVACVVFISIMVYQYIENRLLEEINELISAIIASYIRQYGANEEAEKFYIWED